MSRRGLIPRAASIRLVVVQGPLQAVVAAATVCHAERAPERHLRNVLVIGGLYAARRQALERATRDCAAAVEWERTLTAEPGDRLPALGIDPEDVAEVLCARNWQQLNLEALNAFPDAVHVTYGDAIGVVDTDRREVAPQFDLAMLVLPQPEHPGALDGQRTELVPVDVLRQAIEAARACAVGLAETDADLADFAQGGVLALMGNLTEAGVATLRSEVRQARTLVARVARPGAPVVLKPHPRASVGQAARLARKLRASGHPVRIMVGDRHGVYPIELFGELVRSARTVQPGLSSSAVSLAHVHGVRCHVDLPGWLARSTCFPEAWRRLLGTIDHHRRTLRELENWDGHSPLPDPPDLVPSRAQLLASAVPRRLFGWRPRSEIAAPSEQDRLAAESRALAAALSAPTTVRERVRPSTHLPGWQAAATRRGPLPGDVPALSAEELEELLEIHADVVRRRDRRGMTHLRCVRRSGGP